jgi:hypothetical protein
MIVELHINLIVKVDRQRDDGRSSVRRDYSNGPAPISEMPHAIVSDQLITLPRDPRKFVLMREVVDNSAVECLLKCVTETLSEMFRRSRER